jgi:hypothetical protein
MSGVEVVLGPRQDTGHHQPDTHPAGECHPIVPLTEILLAMGAVSVIPEWEMPGLSAHLPGVAAPDFTVVVGVLQAEAAGAEDEDEGPDGGGIREVEK